MNKKSYHIKSKRLSRRNKERLATLVFLVSGLVIAFVCIFGFVAFSAAKKNMRAFYAGISHDLIKSHIDYFDEFFSDYFSDLSFFSKLQGVQSGQTALAVEALKNEISSLRTSAFDIFFADKQGNAQSVFGNTLDVSNAVFFKKVMEGTNEFALEIFDTASTEEGEFVIATAVQNADENIGAIFYTMRASSITSPVAGMNMGDIFFGFIVSCDGKIILPLQIDSILNSQSEYLNKDDAFSRQNLFEKICAQDDGAIFIHTDNYPDEFIEWARIDKTDWAIAVDGRVEKIDFSTNVFKKQILFLCAFLIALYVVSAILIYVSLVRKNSSHRLTLQQEGDVDSLTGLWTEALFEEEAEKLFKNYPNQNYLIMGLDIRGFRIVQQTEGITEANEQLIALAKRLAEIARQKSGYAARGHIDHFYVMYPIADKESALREFDAMLYNGNFLAGRAGELIPTKTGIVFAGKDYEKDTIQNLIGKTSYAKHMVQDNLLKNYSVYDNTMEARIINDKRIERYIPIAFSHEEFYVVYQPKINLMSGKIIGAEALVRWSSAELGTVMPDSFITLFERNGYITRLDFYVYTKVFEFMNSRIKAQKSIVPVSMNMSRFHLSDEKFVTKFFRLFQNYNISPELIEIEILERSLGIADERARLVAEQLHEKGFRVAIDDFGTGESSLSLISKIPADILKLDRKFMRGVEDASAGSDDEFKVVRQIVEMAKSLGKETICEGVETERQINFLRSINCNYVQGYFYSKPLSEKDFVEYLEAHI